MRIITIDTPLLSGISTGRNTNPDGNPADENYADWAWEWIKRTIQSSDDFDYLFVATHYPTVYTGGRFDEALIAKVLPVMKEHRVSAFIQGHLHTMTHVQEKDFTQDSDIHFYTIGAGALVSIGNIENCNEVIFKFELQSNPGPDFQSNPILQPHPSADLWF